MRAVAVAAVAWAAALTAASVWIAAHPPDTLHNWAARTGCTTIRAEGYRAASLRAAAELNLENVVAVEETLWERCRDGTP